MCRSAGSRRSSSGAATHRPRRRGRPGRVAEPGRVVPGRYRTPPPADPSDPGTGLANGRQHDPGRSPERGRPAGPVDPDGKPVWSSRTTNATSGTTSRDGLTAAGLAVRHRTARPGPHTRRPDAGPSAGPGRAEPDQPRESATRAVATPRVGDSSGTPGRRAPSRSKVPSAGARPRAGPEPGPGISAETRDEDDGGASTGDRDRDRDRDTGSRPAKPGRGDRPDVGPVGDRRHDPDSRTPEPTPDQPGKAGRTAEPAPFVPTTAVGTDSSHADPREPGRFTVGRPSAPRTAGRPPYHRTGGRPPYRTGGRPDAVAGDRRSLGHAVDGEPDHGPKVSHARPERIGDGVPDEAVRFIGERVQRFYEQPGRPGGATSTGAASAIRDVRCSRPAR